MSVSFNRRDFMKIACGGVFAAAAGCSGVSFADKNCPAVSAAGGKRPNLVIVFPDQMRAQAMGFMNEDPVVTPNLDAFSKESLVLTQAVSNYPVCSPFRAMFMSGKVPHKNKVLSNCNSNTAPNGVELQKTDRCWSDVLKDKGYSLGYIGKWHLDSPRAPYINCSNNRGRNKWNEWCEPDRRHGFDFWYSYGTYDYHLKPMYWDTTAPREGFHYVNQWGPEHEADLAVKYLHNEGGKYRNDSKPFALVVSMNPPHTGYNLYPKRYQKAYEGKTYRDLANRGNVDLTTDSPGHRMVKRDLKDYFSMITGVDEQFGRILDGLKAAGLADNTIVLFMADHGNCIGCHNHNTKNIYWEESMRIPFMLRYPGKIQPRKDDLLLSVPDIYPSLLDLMGFGSDIPADVDGTSYAGLFLTGEGKRPDSQWYMKVSDGWVSSDGPAGGWRGVRTHRWTFAILLDKDGGKKIELYDNVNDKYQMKNVAPDNPKVVAQLTSELKGWLVKNSDPWIKHVQ